MDGRARVHSDKGELTDFETARPLLLVRIACEVDEPMSRIVRYEFMGSWLRFWILCITVIGIPCAVLYLLDGTLRVETEMADPEQFVSAFRAGRRN